MQELNEKKFENNFGNIKTENVWILKIILKGRNKKLFKAIKFPVANLRRRRRKEGDEERIIAIFSELQRLTLVIWSKELIYQ